MLDLLWAIADAPRHTMAAKKAQSPAMEFLVESLKQDKKAVYGDLKAEADKKGLAVFPIMFGRAQALLGIVKSAKRGQGKAAKAKTVATQGTEKPIKPGTAKRGRPSNSASKSGQIRELLGSGMSAAEIAAKVGCTPALVYNVKASGKTATKRGPGRPPKAAASTDFRGGLDGIILAVKNSEQQRAQLRSALEKIQAIIASVLA